MSVSLVLIPPAALSLLTAATPIPFLASSISALSCLSYFVLFAARRSCVLSVLLAHGRRDPIGCGCSADSVWLYSADRMPRLQDLANWDCTRAFDFSFPFARFPVTMPTELQSSAFPQALNRIVGPMAESSQNGMGCSAIPLRNFLISGNRPPGVSRHIG